jgi:DNA-binding transcriptional LysR family regulator
MSIYSWEVFVTVAEMQSFVRAAEVLHVSQSAVSHIIRKLEAQHPL